ncbi:ABC transporter ATP-binding protein [Phytoactinopolyspora mesophila]|uniref:ATP-binding cassette domain-containing protein n=1 Tax=Phytoactinopolyspora mesophila TaxID=2650750 RepID=A0A7K3M4J6_9ACTN|nr:ABC transporter ATP-binding protein [Phytoactinopolyspora mesophila]NDL58234.1 ATP-binding cassette domain-containing protein [Phytoactinopolyspora mesophila]
MSEPLLEVRDLRTDFALKDRELRVVDGVSLTVEQGQALAIVGESGSGKSVTMRSVMRVLPKTGRIVGGTAKLNGRDVLALSERQMRQVRGREIGMVFQNAMEALNPTLTLERQLTEHLRWHGICDQAEAKRRAIETLGDVGIPEPEKRIRTYPFQLSGGMRQRAMIAMAMVARPKLLIADEPTTAVDVTVQRQILDLLATLKERGTGVIMITHDLGVARYFCDEAIVMYGGRVVEQASVRSLLAEPAHPYSAGLLRSTVEVGGRHRALTPIPGAPPDLAYRPSGCVFHPRCDQAEESCRKNEQPLLPLPTPVPAGGRDVAARPDTTTTTSRVVACWKAVERG